MEHTVFFLKVLIFIGFFIKDEKSGSLTSTNFFKTTFSYQIICASVKNPIVLI